MATIAIPPITAAEFVELASLPENRNRMLELERGKIVEIASAGTSHASICTGIAGILGEYGAFATGFACVNDLCVVERDPDTVRIIDITFYQHEPSRNLEYGEKECVKVPPKVAGAIASRKRRDTHNTILQRVVELLGFGAEMVCVFDPEVESVAVFRRGKQPYLLKKGDVMTGDDVLPDFRCKVADFFRLPGQ